MRARKTLRKTEKTIIKSFHLIKSNCLPFTVAQNLLFHEFGERARKSALLQVDSAEQLVCLLVTLSFVMSFYLFSLTRLSIIRFIYFFPDAKLLMLTFSTSFLRTAEEWVAFITMQYKTNDFLNYGKSHNSRLKLFLESETIFEMDTISLKDKDVWMLIIFLCETSDSELSLIHFIYFTSKCNHTICYRISSENPTDPWCGPINMLNAYLSHSMNAELRLESKWS